MIELYSYQSPMNRRHRCFNKIRKIFERVGLVTTHAEITYLCENVFHTTTEQDFYKELDKLTDEELSKLVRDLKRKKWLIPDLAKEQTIYA